MALVYICSRLSGGDKFYPSPYSIMNRYIVVIIHSNRCIWSY